MPLTTLDPQTALLVIDLQKGLMGLPTAHPVEGVVQNARTLADAFRRHGLPVVLVNVAGAPSGRTEQAFRMAQPPEGWTDLIPELGQRPEDLTVTKRTVDALTGTGLETELRDRGVTGVVIVGVSTSMGVESTARHARDLGFNVALAIDAMTDTSLDAHEHSVGKVFPRIGETGTVRDVLDRLDERDA